MDIQSLLPFLMLMNNKNGNGKSPNMTDILMNMLPNNGANNGANNNPMMSMLKMMGNNNNNNQNSNSNPNGNKNFNDIAFSGNNVVDILQKMMSKPQS